MYINKEFLYDKYHSFDTALNKKFNVTYIRRLLPMVSFIRYGI